MIDRTISHYKILEKLGEGGMGVVYKAEDTMLKRTVALKFLPATALIGEAEKTRFIHEAQAAAALNHPNICTIYEIDEFEGQPFIAMEFVEGRSLREMVDENLPQVLNLREVTELAIQIAEGLQAAHEKGIIHRDMKCDNVMVNEKGGAKIMDFGLAKLSGRTQVTQEGTTLGTISYMSPEQAHGEAVDHRTDIWSFGVMLYEMITGQLPFQGAYEQAVIYSVMNEDPEPPTALRSGVPMELERVTLKALAKKPEERYQNLTDLLVDVQRVRKSQERPVSKPAASIRQQPAVQGKSKKPVWLGAAVIVAIAVLLFAIWPGKQPATTTGLRSIAVLPFTDLSQNKDQEYFCDGMTEEILTKLAQLPELKVIARTSVMQYKNTTKTIRQIGEELGVETVLEGSVRKAEGAIRVTAQLIKADDESHLWANNYDRKLENIFVLQEEVAKAIAEALHVQMTPQNVSALAKRTHVNLTAHDLVMQGKFAQYNTFDLDRAMGLFDQALEIDSTYVPALVAKAGAYHQRWVFSNFADMEALRRKRELAELAVKLDPKDPEALPILAHAYVTSFSEPTDSVYEMCKAALAHNPNSHWTLEGTAFFFINRLGMYDQGVEYFKLSVERDPFGYIYYNLAGSYLTYLGEYAQAAEMFAKLRARASTAEFASGDEALLAILTGDLARADSLIRQAEKFNINLADANKAYLLAARGQKEAALALEKDPIVYLLLGMHEEALSNLQERARHPTQSQYQFMARFPMFEPLRQDARFIALLEKEKEKLEANRAKYRDLMLE